jgi:hypothetical protein
MKLCKICFVLLCISIAPASRAQKMIVSKEKVAENCQLLYEKKETKDLSYCVYESIH